MAFVKPSTVAMVGAPWCEGQNLEGADLAPVAMRDAGLGNAVKALGLGWEDEGDVDFSDLAADDGHHYTIALYREWLNAGSSSNFSTWLQERTSSPPKKRKREAIKAESSGDETEPSPRVNVVNAERMGSGLRLVFEKVKAVLHSSSPSPFALTVGGDHSIASASISAVLERYPNAGIIWVDAHADANTPYTSPSGHYHGMPAAHLLGWFDKPGQMGDGVMQTSLRGFEWFRSGCLAENKLAYVGLRDVDPEEGRMLRQSGVRVYTMRDVDKHGIARVIEMAIEAVGPSLDCPLHLSLDIDSVDPHFAPGTGTAARGGLSYREIHYICEECALTNRLVSMDLVEVNPGIDPPPAASAPGLPLGLHGDNPELKSSSPTVRLGIECVLSALGKQIC